MTEQGPEVLAAFQHCTLQFDGWESKDAKMVFVESDAVVDSKPELIISSGDAVKNVGQLRQGIQVPEKDTSRNVLGEFSDQLVMTTYEVNGVTSSKPNEVELQNADLRFPRPMLLIEIFGKSGTAIVDTGSALTIASLQLYQLLQDNAVTFAEKLLKVSLADGSELVKPALTCKVQIALHSKELETETASKNSRKLETEITIFPKDRVNCTLLGMNFIKTFGLVIDFSKMTWKFSGELVESNLLSEVDRTMPIRALKIT